MAFFVRGQVFGDHLDADFHRRAADMIHMRIERDQVADIDVFLEKHLIERGGHDIVLAIFGRAGVGHLIEHFQQRTAVHVAGEVGHVRRHQHGHREGFFLFGHLNIKIVGFFRSNE